MNKDTTIQRKPYASLPVLGMCKQLKMFLKGFRRTSAKMMCSNVHILSEARRVIIIDHI